MAKEEPVHTHSQKPRNNIKNWKRKVSLHKSNKSKQYQTSQQKPKVQKKHGMIYFKP